MKPHSKVALITGASSGIGLELAKLFASDNYKLIIVSRNEARLNDVVNELRSTGAASVTVIIKDLSVPGAAAEVYQETTQKGISVGVLGVLVNNAGAGEYGFFSETDLEKELATIHLNISSLVHLTKLYLKDMLAGNGGRILQVASVASYQPTPKLAVYAATKAFVLSFSDAIGTELKNSNVTVTALISNATATDFFRRAGMEHTKASQNNPEDPASVAKSGYEALMKGEPHALSSGIRTQIVMSSVLPNERVASKAEKQMEEVPTG